MYILLRNTKDLLTLLSAHTIFGAGVGVGRAGTSPPSVRGQCDVQQTLSRARQRVRDVGRPERAQREATTRGGAGSVEGLPAPGWPADEVCTPAQPLLTLS